MEPTLSSPLFTRQVVQAMRSLYPEELADRAWDNVGLLQENIEPASGSVPPRVLLTNDLTVAVAEEAIAKRVSVIVSYHPFIFRGLKAVTLNDPHQRIVLRLAQQNIAVYSPHTAIDATLGGVNDWLADMLDEHGVTKKSVVQSIRSPVPAGFEGAGYGRLVELEKAVNYVSIAKTYAERLNTSLVMVARPSPTSGVSVFVRSVAVCAGSGYDVLKDTNADVIVTGEMTHHNALRLTMLGKYVITVFHSNSERGFLEEVLQPQLERILKKQDPAAEVLVSGEDRDPFEIFKFDI
ncbi:GTP cyclohydrolase 1 type 2/Nif3 [Chaetomium strumarium]|uniref:GTP cyclohydrolase 1 type 2/Nif3 n=1 Tax=Chaetomium strumarium TaxID=1170767 RepID=A0AAJ0GTH0_9PEZI|nr:GTP cyclohydrolase 1 type 2/Nif3 [Chaetomium strumarium]